LPKAYLKHHPEPGKGKYIFLVSCILLKIKTFLFQKRSDEVTKSPMSDKKRSVWVENV